MIPNYMAVGMLAEQHQRDLLREAERDRLARRAGASKPLWRRIVAALAQKEETRRGYLSEAQAGARCCAAAPCCA